MTTTTDPSTDTTGPPATGSVAAPTPAETGEAMAEVPMWPMLGAITLACAGAGLLGQVVVWAVQRFGGGLAGTDQMAAWVGAGGLWVAFMAGTFAIRPWRVMPMTRWAALWLAGRGICFIATILSGLVLLYSAPQQNRAVIGLVLAGGYLGVLAAETAVVAKALQRGRGGLSAGDTDG